MTLPKFAQKLVRRSVVSHHLGWLIFDLLLFSQDKPCKIEEVDRCQF